MWSRIRSSSELDEVLENHPVREFGTYHNRVKLPGVKVTLDGSPQGRTAYFTTPWPTAPTVSRAGAENSDSHRTP